MPSAGLDERTRDRFSGDLDWLLKAAGLPAGTPIGVAVSGGPDSMALLLLAAATATGPICAMTVDHGLRPEAAAEAEAVAAVCARLDVPHRIERTGRFVCGGSLQAAAREVRYAALAGWAEREGLSAILTAHHADDQAETVLMRLARGAGLAGLAGVRALRPLPAADGSGGAFVVRPLLGWRKAELEAIVAAAGIDPARDPSNDDDRFDRTLARRLLAEAGWLAADRLAASARHLAEAEAALATLADERYEVRVEDGTIALRPDLLRELRRRHLRRALAEGFAAHPDGPTLERALAALDAGGRTTCADILCDGEGPVWRLRRAPPRRRPG